ncbi:1-acyl-sn-glycerol-3-phosphate acyltransferase [Amycolatopsis sp. GM8]|uniref:lysophospholipid acyltransferase family protein n=1 Tax=Amycolatopsis sp. GM8 TaxID=2896530 RepID=UPI001F3D3BC7|nr:lysophospholipid acyltransferase family protein [Amycolatopsis sp. GM8]
MAGREKGGFWVGFAAVLLYPVTYLSRRAYRGGDRIPREGGALVVMNHISHMDPAVDAVFIHRQGRVPRFLGKASLATTPIFGKIFLGAGSIPVYRGSSSAGDSLRAAFQALRDGKIVVIYPEGTITKDPEGWPKRSFTGVARLALGTDVPVIPIARWGTSEILDFYNKKLRLFPRRTITHSVGEPVDLTPYRDKEQTAAVLREVTELMMGEVTELLADIRGERPPAQKPEPADGE